MTLNASLIGFNLSGAKYLAGDELPRKTQGTLMYARTDSFCRLYWFLIRYYVLVPRIPVFPRTSRSVTSCLACAESEQRVRL